MKTIFEPFDDNNLKHCWEELSDWQDNNYWGGDSMYWIRREEYEEAQEDLNAIAE